MFDLVHRQAQLDLNHKPTAGSKRGAAPFQVLGNAIRCPQLALLNSGTKMASWTTISGDLVGALSTQLALLTSHGISRFG